MVLTTSIVLLSLACLQEAPSSPVDPGADRPRARDLGLTPGILQPGPLNAITDVAGVRVGHKTIIRGDAIRTGVTAIVPHPGNLFQEKVVAGVYPGNAFGKAAGFLQVRELGRLETPIVLTNTLDVGTAVEAVVAWTLARPGNESVRSVNAVVGETNDGYLNDIRAQAVQPADVVGAGVYHLFCKFTDGREAIACGSVVVFLEGESKRITLGRGIRPKAVPLEAARLLRRPQEARRRIRHRAFSWVADLRPQCASVVSFRSQQG